MNSGTRKPLGRSSKDELLMRGGRMKGGGPEMVHTD